MNEIDAGRAQQVLVSRYLIRSLIQAGASFSSRGFEEGSDKWYIAGFLDVDAGSLSRYTEIFRGYFGIPLKSSEEPVVVGRNVPRTFIDYLNRMHGFLLGGILFLEGEMDLQGVVETGVGQQGGSLHPLINLFNMQTLYGRIDGNEVEVVRICPHLRKEISTIEYMVHQSHTEDVDMAIARRKEDIPYFRDERSRLSHAV